MHNATNNKLKNEFMKMYQRNVYIDLNGAGFIKTFLGMEIKQSKRSVTTNRCSLQRIVAK
jgi:hypothetical protein